MDESLCSVEILKSPKGFKAKIQTSFGRYVEYENPDFEGLLHQVYEDLQEEFEASA